MQLISTALNKGITSTTYPILKSNRDGSVVLFTEAGRGVLIAAGAASLAGPAMAIGIYGEFIEDAYTPFIGVVQIEQKP